KYFRVEGSSLVAVNAPEVSGPVSDSPATVFIYRPEKWMGYMQEPSVFVDGTELARMDNGRYLAVRLPPGKHLLHMTDKKRGFAINMGAGERYFFRIAIEPGMWRSHGKLTLVDAATG